MSENKNMRNLNLDQLNAVVGGITDGEKAKLQKMIEAYLAAEAAGNQELCESCKVEYNEYISQLITKYGAAHVASILP